MKKKSSLVRIKDAFKRSRQGGRLNSRDGTEPPVPPLPSPDSRKLRGRKPSKQPIERPSQDGVEYHLDRNIDNMDGIVNISALSEFNPTPSQHPDPHSPGSGFATSTESALSSDASSMYQTSYTSVMSPSPPPTVPSFRDPFRGSAVKRKQGVSEHFDRRISPKTPAPFPPPSIPGSEQGAAWTAPESWEVEKGDGLDDLEPGSDVDDLPFNSSSSFRNSVGRHVRKKSRWSRSSIGGRYGDERYKIRIYRTGNAYHLANLKLTDTVQQIMPSLNEKLLPGAERETHRLYLKERGRGV